MNALLNISASKWCEEIIKNQESLNQSCLTTPRDLNSIVKNAIQEILEYLKSRGINGLKGLHDCKEKECLTILFSWLKKNQKWKPTKAKALTDEELEVAFSDLHQDKYLKCDRKYKDPSIYNQNYALFSFLPSNTAQPDADGIFGFIKIRGTFNLMEEAEEKSKELIQYFSANQIFICETGMPIPLQSNSSNFVEIDHPDNEENENSWKYADLVKEQSKKEKHQIEEIKQKAEHLKADVETTEKEPIQIYLELNQKRATTAYLYTQHLNKLEETKNIILKTRQQLSEMDKIYPNLKQEYMDHYNKKCEECGINNCVDDMALMIKKYFGEDPDLGF